MLATVGAKANSGGPETRTISPRNVGANDLIVDCARTVFHGKTWAHLSAILGLSERAAKSRLCREREFTADEIASLLRSEQGIRFLVALMADARPAWWTALLRMGMLGGIARRRAADLRLLRRVANADRDSIASIPAALRIQDPEFVEPFIEAFDAVSCGEGSSVGTLAKGRGQ